jgi:hypothetical protein
MGEVAVVVVAMVPVLGSMGEGRDGGSVHCLAVRITYVF